MTAGRDSSLSDLDGARAGRIGPNAVIQLADALHGHAAPDVDKLIFSRANALSFLSNPPDGMIDEAIPVRLCTELCRVLPARQAQRIATAAGRRTAEYVLSNRIPNIAKLVLWLSPAGLGTPLLLRAIERSAWPFAGSGICRVSTRPIDSIVISENPLAMPDCYWHQAVFERLLRRLVTPTAPIKHTASCGEGAAACRFEVIFLTTK